MTTEYEFSEYSRSNLVYHFSPFTPEAVARKKRQLAEKKAARQEERGKTAEGAKTVAGGAEETT